MRRVRTRSVPIVLLVAVGAMLSVIGRLGTNGDATEAATATVTDRDAVMATFSDAAVARQADVVPEQVPGKRATPAAIEEMVRHGEAHFGALFTRHGYGQQIVVVHNTAEMLRSGHVRILGGGVSHIDYSSVDVSGATARVQADVTAWQQLAVTDGQGVETTAKPSNVLVVTATLVRAPTAPTGWQVDDFRWRFAAGSRP